MLYLSKVEIYNFRTHENTVIEFSPKTNGLIGLSGSGKTNIIRAIKWNMKNEPSGNEFITSGKTEACVITHWSDGTSIKRIRDKKTKNMYTLLKDGEVVEEYAGFGTNVPAAISDFLNLTEQGSFIFADQLEGPFLLSATPKARAEQIGNLEELEKVDMAIADTNSDIKVQNKAEKELKQSILTKQKEGSKLVALIDENESKIALLNQLKESIEAKEDTLSILENNKEKILKYIKEIEDIRVDWLRAKKVMDVWDDTLEERFKTLQEVTAQTERLKEIEVELSTIRFLDEEKVRELIDLTNHIDDTEQEHQRLVDYSERLERIESDINRTEKSFNKTVASINLESIDVKIDFYAGLFKYAKRLEIIEEEREIASSEIRDAQSEIEQLLNEFVDALHEEKICPTCYQQTEQIEKEQIAKNI